MGTEILTATIWVGTFLLIVALFIGAIRKALGL